MLNFYQLISISYYLILISIMGILQSKSVIQVLIAFELALLACSWNFMIYSLYCDDIAGQVFALIIISVAGAESALGLAALIGFSRLKGNIRVVSLTALKS